MTAPTRIRGQFEAMLREYGRIKNVQRAAERHAANRDLAIPTSGAARRRAKAHRNAGLCMERLPGGLCRESACDGYEYCTPHVFHEASVAA